MRLSTSSFAQFMKDNVDVYVAKGRLPDQPDKALSIIKTSTGRDLNDGIFEEIVYRIQTRGASGSIESAENLAESVDNFLDGKTRFDIGDVYIRSIFHIAAPRQITMTDPESRYNFTADYKVTASRD